jgi:hypothetical protein
VRRERIILFADACFVLWGDACGYGWGKRDTRVSLTMACVQDR